MDRPNQVQAPSLTTILLDRLSAEKQAVARLVLDDLRNREIAQALFVSIRRVELRLTRIYHA